MIQEAGLTLQQRKGSRWNASTSSAESVHQPTGTISLCRGAGDSLIALATVNLEEILANLGTVPRG